jgi:arylsulfatase A-like enzyme
MDMTATFLALAGVAADARWALDGVDLMPFLTGNMAGAPHGALCWEYGTQWAVRQGDWKLVSACPSGKEGGEQVIALYNLGRDIGEKDNRAATEPARVKEMMSAWCAWRGDVLGETAAARVDLADVADAPVETGGKEGGEGNIQYSTRNIQCPS